MPITEKQRAARMKHLGGSDIPILFGFNRFKSLYDLWLDKTGQLEDVPLDSEAAMIGTLHEDGVIKYAESKLGKIRRNQYRSAEGLPIGSNIDGIVVATGEPVEVKVEGIMWRLRDGWGEDGTDQVPYDVILQCHTHIICQQSDICYVAALLGGRGHALFVVKRDDEIIQMIKEAAVDFWENNVLLGIPPKDDLPHIETLKIVKRQPDITATIDKSIVDVYLAAVESRKLAEKTEETAKARLLAEMGQAEAAAAGDVMITYLNQSKSTIDAKKLKEELPDVAAQYTTTTNYRVLRTKTIKGE